MASLTELAEFVEQILRLDTDMPVKGYDGFTIGTANEQAQVLANRTRYLKENLEALAALIKTLTERNVVLSINQKTGEVTLDYQDVGAAPTVHKHSADDITPTEQRLFTTPDEKSTWGNKQDTLVSGESIKTLLGNSLLGEGNLEIPAKAITTDDTFQFISATERETWNNKQNPLVSGADIVTLHGYKLLGGGNVTLTADNVGADPKGSAEDAVDAHEQKADPHPQYLTQDKASTTYVADATANKPNGYLKLDATGQIPASIAELFKVRYLIVGSSAERLAISSSNNVTICLQTDENRIYYLDGGDDPTEESNWHQGRDADPSAVVSVFGRSGVISSNSGDYNADQITESETRVFVTPEQKQTWLAKQDKLVSGKNIRTINKKSLLGTTDIDISPTSINAADRVHTHTVEDIKTTSEKTFVSSNEKTTWNNKQDKLTNGKNIKTLNQTNLLGDGNITISPSTIGAAPTSHTHAPGDIKTTSNARFVSDSEKSTWNGKQDKLTSGKNSSTVFGKSLLDGKNVTLSDVSNLNETIGNALQAGDGIDISYDKTLDRVVVNNTSKGGGGTASEITTITVESSEVKEYKYNVGKMSHDFVAYTLVGNVQSAAHSQSYTYSDTVMKTLIQNALPTFGTDGFIINPQKSLSKTSIKASDGLYYTSNIDVAVGEGIGLEVPNTNETYLIPTFSGFTNDEDAKVDGYTVFASRIYPNFQAWKAYQAPMDAKTIASIPLYNYWSDSDLLPKECYLGINTGVVKQISGYAFQTFQKFATTLSSRVTGWVFQGLNNDTGDWDDLDTQSGQSVKGNGEWKQYPLAKKANYKQYRVLVKDAENTKARPSIPRFQLMPSPSSVLIKGKDNKFYTIKDGQLTAVGTDGKTAFLTEGIESTTGFYSPTLKSIAPFKLVSEAPLDITFIRHAPASQIVIHTSLEKTESWYNLNTMSATLKNGGDEDRIYVAVTVDGKKWYTLKNNVWVSLSTLTGDKASATKVINANMTVRDLTKVTKAQWAVLVGSMSSDATLGIAYASLIRSKTDQRTPTKVTADFGRIAHWTLAPLSDVTVSLTSTDIVFYPKNIKAKSLLQFCYKFN